MNWKTLTDEELRQHILSAQTELTQREKSRKQEVLAKIRELGASIGIEVVTKSKQRRPAKPKLVKPAAEATSKPEKQTA